MNQRRLLSIVAGIFALKVLLIYSYHSTDFEVHRNWLAVTFHRPVEKWYFENTSEWTLDYPPFFAYFEYGLSHLANAIDTNITRLSATPVFCTSVLLFQRLSVIVTDILYAVVAYQSSKKILSRASVVKERLEFINVALPLLFIFNVGLIMVDSIHFQYNGLLFAMLMLSINALMENAFITSAVWFCALLNFKHIFLYMAPAYGAYFLRNYCFNGRKVQFSNCLKLITVLLVICTSSFGPFIINGSFTQLFSRLFPFKRGLTHAYWAPNFWALYNFSDLLLAKAAKHFMGAAFKVADYSSGLVGDYEHLILPNITPKCCFMLTLTAMLPLCLVVLRRGQHFSSFSKLLVFCSFCSYMFGWHVHEKAILLCTLPLTYLALNIKYTKIWIMLNIVGNVSLFPLFFTPFESPVKYLLVTINSILVIGFLDSYFRLPKSKRRWILPFLNVTESLYIFGLISLEFYCSFLHVYVLKLDVAYPFVPLMLTSVYCAIGVVYCFVLFGYRFVCDETNIDLKLYKRYWLRSEQILKQRLSLWNTELWQNDCSFTGLKFIGGLDISTVVQHDYNAVACLVIMSFPDLKILHSEYEHVFIDSPYVPGFLSWREANIYLRLLSKIKRENKDLMPQLLLIDGNGYLHPRKFGLACHVGVKADLPCIGVAKNLLIVPDMPSTIETDIEKFSSDEEHEGHKTIIRSVSTKENLCCAIHPNPKVKKPIFVSVGHRISLTTACDIVSMCCRNYRVPEPVRQADLLSRAMVRSLHDGTSLF